MTIQAPSLAAVAVRSALEHQKHNARLRSALAAASLLIVAQWAVIAYLIARTK